MNDTKYLIWLDILGFENIAYEISKGGNEKVEAIIKNFESLENQILVFDGKYGNNSDWLIIKESLNDIKAVLYQDPENKKLFRETRAVRSDLITVIQNRINYTIEKELIIGYKYGNSDDWLLVAKSFNDVFIVIKEILDHNSFYPKYMHIPLEIAIGTASFDRWAILNGNKIIIEEDTIKFLKSYVLNYYHKWFKENNNTSIRKSFVVFTEEAFKELEPLDKTICNRIDCQADNKLIKFYSANLAKIFDRAKVCDFKKKIGYANSRKYDRIDSIYVPPKEYEKIEKTLSESRIVFITGTPECGKTYTAIRLLWLYFCKGYEPKLITGSDESERLEGRKELELIQSELKPRTITFFDDPFGIYEYEGRESLERD